MCRGKIVAAKALKPHATKEYLQSLLGEIKILSHVGRHDFIVNMEAAYTKDIQKGNTSHKREWCLPSFLTKCVCVLFRCCLHFYGVLWARKLREIFKEEPCKLYIFVRWKWRSDRERFETRRACFHRVSNKKRWKCPKSLSHRF